MPERGKVRMNRNTGRNGSQQQMLQFISEISFTIEELVLFLDTHPCDQDALAYYDEMKKLRKKAIEEYTDCYGPLFKYNVNADNEWQWIMTPWPWEGACS